ncbi:phospholipase D-like domain-containing protein [Methanothermococcus okinawensis]|uniref:phospholipase D-like domain-containing protein n=1 Tax=Methanothermococcus okinawensis TaxID=155863 RepID=UPI001E4F612E|nr:phospholipase D-like domain-containing protein [Methanothermococcus okinawensis]
MRNEANHGSNGRIIAKMNSLVDMDVIKELYRASQKGVEIDLIVRGICCLKPGIKGISDNIRVRSIVGKYLEHARVFYFKNNGDEILYLSSADWMPRNFNKRVETMFPVESNTIKEYIKEILNIQLRDTTKARIMQPDGTYIRTEQKDCNSQEYFEKWVKLKDINNI